MILNALSNQFVVQFPPDFFYPKIKERWDPIVQRLKLPYMSMVDFMNSAIQSINFPTIELRNVEQQQSQFRIQYRPGKELEPIYEKNLTVNFKLSEGFITYWIIFEQIEAFLEYEESLPFWPPMYISFLDHHGFELVVFEFEKIIPRNMSQFTISHATTAADFNTFSLGLRYNRFNIKNRLLKKTF